MRTGASPKTRSITASGKNKCQEIVKKLEEVRQQISARHDYAPSAYFFSAASRLRSAAMVAAEESLRLLFFGRRFVLLV
jgi:hypothetical protein